MEVLDVDDRALADLETIVPDLHVSAINQLALFVEGAQGDGLFLVEASN